MLTKNKLIQLIAIAISLFVAAGATLQAEETKQTIPAYPGWGTTSPAMQNSMKPETMKKMINMMSDPAKMLSMENCASCHEGEQLARIAKDWGPTMSSMKPMMDMMNPMTGMVEPMMNPMISMMHPMADMMGPMMGMMNPMMSMMGPMMNPMMGMMNPMMAMGAPMMNPMMGMMNPMMAGMTNPAMFMNPGTYMSMMGPMMNPMGMMGMGGYGNSNSMGQMMDPKQYEQWFNQWTDMMNNMTPQTQQ